MLFNFDFTNKTIFLCFFFFLLIIDLSFLITQIYNPTAELVIPIVIPTKEAKAEMETYPVIVEQKARKCSI